MTKKKRKKKYIFIIKTPNKFLFIKPNLKKKIHFFIKK